jgi:putative tributyrin esterase
MRVFPLLLLFVILGPGLRADSAQPGNVQTITITSEALKSSRKALVLLPRDYDRSNRRYPVLYLLHGFSGNHEDWFKRTNLAAYAARYPLILVSPDGESSYYSNSLTRPDYQYEDFIVRDLVSHIDSRYRTIANRHARAIAGLSMGGYGAMKLGLKYPQLYSAVASFSGTFTRAQPGHKASNPVMAKVLQDVFGPDNHAAHRENDPFLLVRKLGPYRPDLYFSCGNSDTGPLASNREFAALLSSLGIPYEYREPAGVHNWEVWDSQIQEYLRVLARVWRLQMMPPGLSPAPPAPPRPPLGPAAYQPSPGPAPSFEAHPGREINMRG